MSFTPALGYNIFTSWYDSIVRFTCRESTFKTALVKQASISNSDAILDVGSGTGTFAILIQTINSKKTININGLDADPTVIKIAEKKAKNYPNITFHQGFSNELPLPFGSESMNIIFSSLFFHHLKTEDKIQTLRGIHNTLKTGGQLHVADWGKSSNIIMRLLFYFIQVLDGFQTTHQDNVEGRLPQMMIDAGFSQVHQTCSYSTIFGTLSLYSAKKA